MFIHNENKKIFEELLLANPKSRKDLDCFKRQIAKKYNLPLFKTSELISIYHEFTLKKAKPNYSLEKILIKRPVRSLSGIVNVSVLTKPYPCPGKCIFCPTQKNIPKSYLAGEPAVQRAIANKFSPYKQVEMRLKALQATGHPIDKVELRIIGGTWSYYSRVYRKWFIAECFKACNEFNKRIRNQKSGIRNLEELQKQNEKVKCRIVGIAVETRPDYINAEEIKFMRELGITKVELGVQAIDDKILKLNQRGHSVESIITATRLLKNAGFKVSYQMMPGLYGSTPKKDLAMFQEIFTNPNFKPDYLKIYPLALVKNTKLYNLYKQKKFKPYTKNQLIKLIVEIKKIIPCWVRVERIIRDIPPTDIVEGGSNILNMREIVAKEMANMNLACKCVRCREVGANYESKERIYLFKQEYEASGGKPASALSGYGVAREIFLSFENKNKTKLFGLLRLRITDKTAIVRELHVYGQMAQISRPQGSANLSQHKGLGKKLLAQAEKIVYAEQFNKAHCKRSRSTKQNRFSQIAVISGVGVRPYYRKLGYKLQNTYMVKKL
ncbi:MAG: tRNA uridine(34) 5-carboxymethylaminomethyl modification radical SAM/GNAT enzyme Elp3 [Candidatus Pacebacteria bacterium]|nr:tRNA uridine(34) 5-carboxymethylaminomethyl modification radical SAM/GNAT enzyme Elp3 [Candidatus Paceibacterota bacterium]